MLHGTFLPLSIAYYSILRFYSHFHFTDNLSTTILIKLPYQYKIHTPRPEIMNWRSCSIEMTTEKARTVYAFPRYIPKRKTRQRSAIKTS